MLTAFLSAWLKSSWVRKNGFPPVLLTKSTRQGLKVFGFITQSIGTAAWHILENQFEKDFFGWKLTPLPIRVSLKLVLTPCDGLSFTRVAVSQAHLQNISFILRIAPFNLLQYSFLTNLCVLSFLALWNNFLSITTPSVPLGAFNDASFASRLYHQRLPLNNFSSGLDHGALWSDLSMIDIAFLIWAPIRMMPCSSSLSWLLHWRWDVVLTPLSPLRVTHFQFKLSMWTEVKPIFTDPFSLITIAPTKCNLPWHECHFKVSAKSKSPSRVAYPSVRNSLLLQLVRSHRWTKVNTSGLVGFNELVVYKRSGPLQNETSFCCSFSYNEHEFFGINKTQQHITFSVNLNTCSRAAFPSRPVPR